VLTVLNSRECKIPLCKCVGMRARVDHRKAELGMIKGILGRTVRRHSSVAIALAVSIGLACPMGATAGSQSSSGKLVPTRAAHLVRVARVPRIPNHTHFLGRVAADTFISGAVALKPRHALALKRFIEEVTSPGSSLFHSYLSRQQYRERFGPSPHVVSAAERRLQADGLNVSGVSSNGLMVFFSGNAQSVETAFHTSLGRYRLAHGGVGYATTSPIQLPASIAGSVRTVVGLDDLVRQQSAGPIRPPASMRSRFPAATGGSVPHTAVGPDACSAADTAARINGGLTDAAIANAYGASGLYKDGDNGRGQTIAVFELEPFLPSDIKTFDTCFFGASRAGSMVTRLHTIPVDGGQPRGQGSGESILDVDDLSGVAPGATIDVYTAPNTTFGSIDEYDAIVSSDKANIVSSSWGLCERALQVGEPGIQQEENDLFQEAAAQGMSIFAAAGDAGSDDCNSFYALKPVAPVLSVDDPSSNPYVVSVGGSTIDNATQAPVERVWNDGAEWGAGGGGISESWQAPSWQQGPLVPGIHGAANASAVTEARKVIGNDFCGSTMPCREVPDVASQGDEFTGSVTTYSTEFELPSSPNGWTTIGGTSSSAPLWAAATALVNASPACAENAKTAHGVGFISPLLYAVASVPAEYAASFNDITSGNNDDYSLDNGGLFHAGKGFDMASGLGSPQLTAPNGGDGLAYYLCNLAGASVSPAVDALSPNFGSTAGGNHIVITGVHFGSGSGGTFKSQVSGIYVGSVRLPAADVSVTSSSRIDLVTPPASSQNAPDSAADGAGPAAVTVTLKNGQSSRLSARSTYDYVDDGVGGIIPEVTSIDSYAGPEAGGNVVTILGSGFSATGADKITSVTFGGVPATVDAVSGPRAIQVTAPPYHAAGGSPLTQCSTDLDPTNDICQVEVVVTNANGSSRTESIFPTYEGTIRYNATGVVAPPHGCMCEVAPQPTEYDYSPAPTIKSISTTGAPPRFASENGVTTITITGAGFNPATLNGIYVGEPTSAGFTYAELTDTFSFLKGNEIQLIAPEEAPTSDAAAIPVTVWTAAGLSKSSAPATEVTYAGTPVVSNLSAHYGPAAGGESVTVTGSGMSDTFVAQFVDIRPAPDGLPPLSFGSTSLYTIHSEQSVTLQTPAQNPGIVNVELCTATTCSATSDADHMTIYPPGNPSVGSSGPASGPAQGGTMVKIQGQNLGCATEVSFGAVTATAFSNAPAILDCGQTNVIFAEAPPGPARKTVHITVTTAESHATRFGSTKPKAAAEFTYKKSPPSAPQDVAAFGASHTLRLKWKPPATNGGDRLLGYSVRMSVGGVTLATKKLSADTLKASFSKLTPAASYMFTVRARSKLGSGLPASVGG
jgi:hypothetical protein